uniref:Uncharacterized protein LOC100179483 n=1 Tax=Phallusia mammillata TaxID=59560 RepID=A0A6F9DHP6_9ASCI|nr:uncharacterized protein LOC100179483 [Phallusia mammillata]
MLLGMQGSNHVEQNHINMHNNKNSNNNHNTRNVSPVRSSTTQSYKNDNHDHADDDNNNQTDKQRIHNLEESRRLVESFLKRSLSQNAKASMENMKPEGYYKLKRDGRLAFYQRQQSKPEQGILVRKEPTRSNSLRPAVAGLPSRPSLNELTSEAKKKSMINRPMDLPQMSTSDQDIRMTGDAAERGSPMIESLINDDSAHSGFQSSDSLGSLGEDNSHMRRRKSFTKAVTRKSVISYIEEKKRHRERSGESNSTPTRTPAEPKRMSRTPDIIRRFSTKAHRKLSVSEPLSSTWHGTSSSDTKQSEDVRTSQEKKLTLKDRMKRLMAGPSNKKKLQYRQSFEKPWVNEIKVDETRTSRSSNKSEDHRQGPPVEPKMPQPLPQKITFFLERSPSPPKSKNTAKLYRSTSTKPKSSPKVKHRTLAPSNSSSSFDALSTGNLERDKSESLPSSVRLGVNYDDYNDKSRRYSAEFSTIPPKRHSSSKKHVTSNNTSPVRPDHLDLNHKKKSGKFKKFLQFWKKRHPSESSSSSSESCHSQSEPSLHLPLSEEEKRNEHGTDPMRGDKPDSTELEDMPQNQSAPYQHRGSLSFSAADLDGLTLPEKQQLHEEIAETLRRISMKYNRHIQSRSSSTPGSRIVTPDSSFSSSQEYRYIMKTTRSDPPARQNSRNPVQPASRSFRSYRDEGQPAMNAYMNLQKASRSNESLGRYRAAKMPRNHLVRRHTQHTFTGSLDSPYNRHTGSRKRLSPRTERKIDITPLTPPREVFDVTDGIPFADDSLPPASGTTTVRPAHTRGGSIISVEDFSQFDFFRDYTSNGSEVDHQSYYERHTEIRSAPGYGEPSTSTTQFTYETRDTERESIDEDKLVQQLVAVLCQKGDQYTRSIDMPPIPVENELRWNVARYMATTTFSHFQQFANRFCSNMKQLVANSPTRHPDVFPIVMVLNMTHLVVDIVSSEQTREAVDNAVSFSTRLITEFFKGRSMESFLNDLNETEEELSSVETPSSDGTGSPRRLPPNTGSEVD